MAARFVRIYNPAWGICRWCQQPILDKSGQVMKRRRWHSICTKRFFYCSTGYTQRRAVRARAKSICQCCQTPVAIRSEFHVDHIVPLHLLPPTIPDHQRVRWYGLINLQLLCLPCHKRKTAAEAASRAAARKANRCHVMTGATA